MNRALNKFFVRIIPFIGLGIFLILLAVGFVIFSYLLIFGAILGLVIFAFYWVYNLLTGRNKPNMPRPAQTRRGRTIDHDQ